MFKNVKYVFTKANTTGCINQVKKVQGISLILFSCVCTNNTNA